MKNISERRLVAYISLVAYVAAIIFVCISSLYEMNVVNVKNQQLTITFNHNENEYVFQDKVKITHKKVNEYWEDELTLRVSEWGVDEQVVLTGVFYKVGWHKDTLFILNDDFKFYVFDINSYMPPTADNGEKVSLEYKIKEMTTEEFKQRYPEYRSFFWRKFYG